MNRFNNVKSAKELLKLIKGGKIKVKVISTGISPVGERDEFIRRVHSVNTREDCA